MVKVQIDYKSNKLDKAIQVYKIRHNFVTKAEAIVDVLKRFFSKEDSEYFIKANEEMPINEEEPEYTKNINNGDKKKHGKSK